MVEKDFDKWALNHMLMVAEVVQKLNISDEKAKDLAYKAALVHDLGKFYNVFTTVHKDFGKQNLKYKIGLLHGVTGAYYLKKHPNNIIKLFDKKSAKSIIKIIACHTPYYVKEEELKDLKGRTMPLPLPWLDCNKKQKYALESLNLKIRKLSGVEKFATQILVVADHSVAEGKIVSVEERLEQIFRRYGKNFSEEGKKVYATKVLEIRKKVLT